MQEKIASTIKSNDTEEYIDIIWTRQIGYLWAKFFEKLGVHPNTVTIISMILGAMAGICFYFPSYRYGSTTTFEWMTPCIGLTINICGVLLLAWANFYDSADGQLARMTGKKTKLGRILDGAASEVWFIFIYHAIVFRVWNQNIPFTEMNWGVIAYLYTAVDGFICHPVQGRIADYYRNIHLYFLKGKEGSEVDTYEEQKKIYDSLSWRENFVEKFFQMFYINWCKGQAKDTPQLQKLLAKVKEKYGTDIPQSFRDEYRKNSFPLLKWTNFLTFNWRAIFLYISCLSDEPMFVVTIEIFIFTAVRIYMNRKHESFCKKMLANIQ
ncbi:MAG: CDP-alcohol phosphatidyltransferase family protein [Prevotellaceae bacterium]|nr:CDP-alcohol phosphatidyltransferase family protein [Candidatus Minthosoma caballi]